MAAEAGTMGDRNGHGTAHGTGVVIGVALMGALDEIVFHQLLQWHHFYVHTTEFWRIFSDGLFHAFTTALWLVGAFLLWSRRRRLAEVVGSRSFWAGVLFGMGGFQLFDGIVNHKILRIHQVREGANVLWPYDAAWIASGLLLLGGGRVVGRSIRRASGVERWK